MSSSTCCCTLCCSSACFGPRFPARLAILATCNSGHSSPGLCSLNVFFQYLLCPRVTRSRSPSLSAPSVLKSLPVVSFRIPVHVWSSPSLKQANVVHFHITQSPLATTVPVSFLFRLASFLLCPRVTRTRTRPCPSRLSFPVGDPHKCSLRAVLHCNANNCRNSVLHH